MTDENSNSNGESSSQSSNPNRKRSSACLTDSEVNNSPQVGQKKSGIASLKRVFTRILGDVTNTHQNSPTTPQSEVVNHPLFGSHSIDDRSVNQRGDTNQPSKRLKPNLNTSGLTRQSSQCDISIRQSTVSSNRACSDIRPTNLFKAFSTSENRENQSEDLGSVNLDLFEDQDLQIYDINSEEEDNNYNNNSDSETECLPQQDQNVSTVPDEQRARILSMASIMKSVFEDKPGKKGCSVSDKPAKKGWSVSKCTVSKPKKYSTPPQHNMDYVDEGDPTHKCEHCGAIMWYGERIEKKRQNKKPKFSLCCGQGQVQLPLLKQSPEILRKLLNDDDEISKYYRENIRQINMVFSFTSLGGKIDRSALPGPGPRMVVLQGENYHLMGSLKPPTGGDPKFGQLYIVDTENEIQNRASIIGKYKTKCEKAKKESLRKQVIERIVKMLDEVNPYVHQFRTARERFSTNPGETLHMRIVSNREKDRKYLNLADLLLKVIGNNMQTKPGSSYI